MAYLAFTEEGAIGFSDVAAPPAAPASSEARHAREQPRLSSIEWAVVALAATDPLSSLRSRGRVSAAMGLLFGSRPNPILPDERLEALRRVAVLMWHRRSVFASSELKSFADAGFSQDHYELISKSIEAGR